MRFKITHINFPILLLSFCIAVGAWYAITINERMDMHISVKLDYKNAPKNLVITEGLIDNITVHVRGPKALLLSYDAKQPYTFSLANLTKGENIISFLQPDMMGGSFRAFEVLDITPTQIVVQADTLLERNVPIKPKMHTVLHSSAFKVQDLHIAPNTALLRGPEKIISKIESIPLDIRMDTTEKAGSHTKKVPLVTTAAQSTVTPSFVTVSYKVVSQRIRKTIDKTIVINGEQNSYTISPSTLSIHVEFPEALKNNKSYLNGITVRVTPPLLEPGKSATVHANVSLPEGMTLTDEPHEEFTITRLP